MCFCPTAKVTVTHSDQALNCKSDSWFSFRRAAGPHLSLLVAFLSCTPHVILLTFYMDNSVAYSTFGVSAINFRAPRKKPHTPQLSVTLQSFSSPGHHDLPSLSLDLLLLRVCCRGEPITCGLLWLTFFTQHIFKVPDSCPL